MVARVVLGAARHQKEGRDVIRLTWKAGSSVDNSHETQAGFEGDRWGDLTRGGSCGGQSWLLRACKVAGRREQNN